MDFIYLFIIIQTRKHSYPSVGLGSQTAISSDLGYHSNALSPLSKWLPLSLKHHRQLPSLSQGEKTVCLSANDSAAFIVTSRPIFDSKYETFPNNLHFKWCWDHVETKQINQFLIKTYCIKHITLKTVNI